MSPQPSSLLSIAALAIGDEVLLRLIPGEHAVVADEPHTISRTVCFGIATANGTCTESHLISAGRERIRRAPAFAALDLVRRALLDSKA